MFRNYDFNKIDEVEKFKEDVQVFILKLDDNEIEIINTSKGYPAIIDKDIADEVKKYRWYGNDNLGGAYALRKIKKENQYLQNFVWKLKTGRQEDQITFKNKLTVDCRIKNLAGGSRTNVMNNRRPKRETSSEYKGVCFDKITEKWRAHIRPANIYYTLGKYENEEKAAKVYDSAAKILLDDPYLNFKNDTETEEADAIAKRYIDLRKARIKKKMDEQVKKNKLKEEKDLSSTSK